MAAAAAAAGAADLGFSLMLSFDPMAKSGVWAVTCTEMAKHMHGSRGWSQAGDEEYMKGCRGLVLELPLLLDKDFEDVADR